MAESERRRRRPAVSCTLCRKRKIRCDRQNPCSNCVRARAPHLECVYDAPPASTRRDVRVAQRPINDLALAPKPAKEDGEYGLAPNIASHASELVSSSGSMFTGGAATTASTPSSRSSGWETESMRSRIAQLEEQLSQMKQLGASQLAAASLTKEARADEIPPLSDETQAADEPPEGCEIFGYATFNKRSVFHKRRVFGQSHWINGLFMFRDLFRKIAVTLNGASLELGADISRCKAFARVIKARRTPPWPTLPTTDLPARDLADQLVDCYVRTTESVYRILHLPTFWRSYESVWTSQDKPDMDQLVTLKLVLAIGAAMYDEAFSMRDQAHRWVHEAHAWLSRPDFKARVTMQAIQAHMLLALAREACGVNSGMAWITMDGLLRTAIFAGLHRDPSRLPPRTTLSAELRRRLWSTLLEMALLASLNTGGPPLISLDDFDTLPPGNFNDEQLTLDNPDPRPEGEFTQSSVARALSHTFPARLAIAKFLNDLGSRGGYEETLKLDAELRAAHKHAYRSTHGRNPSEGRALLPTSFQASYVDFTLRRSLLALHVPFFGPSLREAAYAFTRRIVVETSIILWRLAYGPSTSTSALHTQPMPERSEFSRLLACRADFFSPVAMQVSLFMLAEVRAHLQESDGLAAPVRQDLLPIMTESTGLCLHCIEMGETNIKGYILTSLVAGEVEGLMQGLGQDELPQFLMGRLRESIGKCRPILEKSVAKGEPQESSGKETQSPYQPNQSADDWDFTVFESGVSSNGIFDSIDWMFDDEIMHAPEF